MNDLGTFYGLPVIHETEVWPVPDAEPLESAGSYEDYRAAVQAQETRDRERFMGIGNHEPAAQPSEWPDPFTLSQLWGYVEFDRSLWVDTNVIA